MEQLTISQPDQPNICAACGTRYAAEKMPEGNCLICDESRQYMKPSGQQWISYTELAEDRTIGFKLIHPKVYQLHTDERIGIGQRAFLITSDEGNVLWDCLGFIDAPTVTYINDLGGLKAIAISHPHYYSLMAVWAKAFDCPIYLHRSDKQWVMDDDSSIKFFGEGTIQLSSSVTVIRTGGHFEGSTVLHYEDELGNGILFIADSLFVSRDRKRLSAMYSYPNLIPLPKTDTLKAFERLKHLSFSRMYGGFEGQDIPENAREIFDKSYLFYQHL